MNVKLTKVYREDIEGGLRTPIVEGICDNIPSVGEPFLMVASSLTPDGNFRYIQTSRVVSVDILDNIVTIVTESNSIYTIEILG